MLTFCLCIKSFVCGITMVRRVLALLLCCTAVRGHGTMVHPTPRQPESMYWYQVGCMIGCDCSGGGKETYPSLSSVNCTTPAAPTLQKSQRTWNVGASSPRGDWNRYMPWRAPGSARPLDPCGIASGFLPDATVQYPHKFKSSYVHQGMKGTALPQGPIATWTAGADTRVSFNLVVNHGGGYQYRVCKIGDGATGDAAPTEACFERSPLRFANRASVVRFRDGGTRVLSDATDVTEGVRPAGSAWRRLPIPACACDIGTDCHNASAARANDTQATAYGTPGDAAHLKCSLGLQFPAAHLKDGTWPEGYGYYVADLGHYEAGGKGAKAGQGAKSSDQCGKFADKSACQAAAAKQGCTWYATKSVCYTAKATGACEAQKDAAACSKAGCQWYSAKNACWSGKSGRVLLGRHLNAFGGQSAAKDTTAPEPSWQIEDEVVAPDVPGRYLLQWRWDNEQTPQIWTTCADVEVVKAGVPWGLVAGVAAGVVAALGAAAVVSRKWKGHGKCAPASAKMQAMSHVEPVSAQSAGSAEPAGQLQVQVQKQQA